MVFPSAPVYLDPPPNWHHQAQNNLGHHHGGGGHGGGDSPDLPQLQPTPQHVMGAIRPRSMADRARMARLPQPDPGLKCPRCDSTNTKFCYFNNYSLTQPRHFCKTCRRYWTRGGALRNVPVGGGCRRNKRSSRRRSNSNKSPSVTNSHEDHQLAPPLANNNSRSLTTSSTSGAVPEMLLSQLESTHLPFMASLQNFGHYGVNDSMAQPMAAAGNGVFSGGGGGPEQWRIMGQMQQQFPNFLGGFEQNSNLFALPSADQEGGHQQQFGSSSKSGSDNHHMGMMIKMEETNNLQRLNLSSQILGMNNNSENNGDHEYWVGNKWVDDLSSSSSAAAAAAGLGSSSNLGHFFSRTSA